MAQEPGWASVISWSRPITLADLNVDRSVIPEASGFYAFTTNPGPLKIRGVLYIGETMNLRIRVPKYLVHDARRVSSDHKGAFLVAGHRGWLANDKSIYLRWSLFDSGRALLRDIEAAMIQYYDPEYNTRDWDRYHPFDD